jgi:DHA2 family multidrug resistance protein
VVYPRFGQLKLFVGSVTCLPDLVPVRLCPQHDRADYLPRAAGLFRRAHVPDVSDAAAGYLPTTKRSMALALLSMVTVVAPIVGPITGGWITDNYSWPWIFYINVPIGIFAAIVVWTQLREREETTTHAPIDYIGIMLLVLGVGLLQVVLDKGNDLDWFSSTEIIVMSVISAIALVSFVIWELGERHPIVNLRLFADRNFAIGTPR